MKKFLSPLSIMLTLLLILIILFGFYIYSKIPKTTHLSKIETMTVKPHYPLSFQGVQQAKQSYTLYYEPSLGISSDILVKNNETISKDTPIFKYYNPHIEKHILAKKKLLSSIQHSNKISSDNFNQQVQLSNDILNLQQQLQTRIYAPIKGRVTVLHPFPSKSHTEIMQINSDERIIRAKINESQLKRLKNNQLVQVSIKNTRQFEGKILSISSIPYKTELSSSFYYVNISTDPSYPIGYHFDLHLGTTEYELPNKVIYNKNYVLVIHNKKIIKRNIKYIKSKKSGYIMVSNGLSIGDKVITHPSASLLESNE